MILINFKGANRTVKTQKTLYFFVVDIKTEQPQNAVIERAATVEMPWKHVKAKFHYASWFGAGSELLRSWFDPDSVMEFGFY